MTRIAHRSTKLPDIPAAMPGTRPASAARVRAAAFVPGALAIGFLVIAYDALPLGVVALVLLLAGLALGAGWLASR